MKKHKLLSLSSSLHLCILWFSLIISSPACRAADYQYEACVPTANCGSGPNISFPFFIPHVQESYCGFPNFVVTCRNGVPFLQMSDNGDDDYIIQDIFYHNQSLRVFNSAALSPNGRNCPPRIRNTTLPPGIFDYVGVTSLHLLSDCWNVSGEFGRYEVVGCKEGSGRNGTLAMYDSDGNLGAALERCGKNVVAPVEEDERESGGVVEVAEVLRRGFLMNWTASDCNDCQESGGRCGFNQSSFHFQCFCPDRPHSRSCTDSDAGKNSLKLILAICIPGVAILIILFAGGYIFWMRKKNTGGAYYRGSYAKEKQKHEKDIELFLKINGNLAPMRYKYSSINKMTNSFSEELGRGGFGSVYKGKFLDGRLVAVKVLKDSNGNGEDFMNEVASISRTSHINIVTLLGYCIEGSKRALIYDFMPNGSLEKFIGNDAESVLGWDKLFEIALGIARGLEYLHQGCSTRILHLDIKPQNILLDKDLNPKISDFGLAKLCPNRSSVVSMLGARGTIGYVAPEVFSRNFGGVSYKSDVYSYGMLVLEMVGGRRDIDRIDVDHTSEIYFPHYIYKELEMDAERDADLADIMDDEVESQSIKRNLTIVGLWCVQTNPKDRPSMTKVVDMLEGKLGSLEVPPKPYLYSPPRPAPTSSISDSL